MIRTVTADEWQEKDRRIQAFLTERNLTALLLSGKHNFAWATCGGDNHVTKGGENGVGSLLFTRDGGKFLLCDNIEAGRFRDEEQLEVQGFQTVSGPWYTFDPAAEVQRLTGGESFGADSAFPGATLLGHGDIAPLRYVLTPAEIERYRWLGRTATEAMETTAEAIDAGMTEHEVGAVLDHFLEDEGITPFLTLVASDERIRNYRHPISTGKTVENYVMYVTCASAFGLIACATRLVAFGKLSDEVRKKHVAVCKIDAVMNLSTVPGTSVAEIMDKALATYAETGYADEWTLHHQGGSCGYAGRDYKAVPGMQQTVQPHQAFAWNPSITGTKSEDTILATENGPEFLTAHTDTWPTILVETPYGTLERPAILER